MPLEYENKAATETSVRSQPMFSDLKSVLLRSRETLIEDAAGALALMVMLVVGLHLPGLV